jgi:hypothetical protein
MDHYAYLKEIEQHVQMLETYNKRTVDYMRSLLGRIKAAERAAKNAYRAGFEACLTKEEVEDDLNRL